jgi:DNA-binding transcriptional regulator YdaS (Cro superfamily)
MDDRQRIAAAQAFQDAVAAANSQSEFERRTGLKQQRVSTLIRRGDVLPAEYVLATEREFGISKHILRPDIYPPSIAPEYSSAENTMPHRYGIPDVPVDCNQPPVFQARAGQ